MPRKSRLIFDAANRVLGIDHAGELSKSMDVIGDIAILKMPGLAEPLSRELGEELLRKAPYLRVVLRQSTPVIGDHRIRGLEWLAGEKRTVTYHREYGCLFKVDVAKVYFSPRLSSERMRVAGMVEEGETVLNMFAGVGCFSILIAKRLREVKVYSIDLNPEAVHLMLINTVLNKVQGRVISILGDSKTTIYNLFREGFDRVLMPLPEKAGEYLTPALYALKPEGGMIHYQSFVHADKGENPVIGAFKGLRESLGDVDFEVEGGRIVREVGPFRYQVALDIKVFRKKQL
ncbi:MAG: class I SAM-dependent methyltransferase family protein [Candidatus Bathyarchaeia archaeon]